MARPKEQTARREELVGAAARAIAERGLDGLRIKDIAAQAGMSPGSVLYYFPELDELVLEVHRDAVERYLAARRSRVEQQDGPVARLRALLATALPAGAEDEPHALLYELHRRAGRSPGHAALMASLWAREVALYATALQVGQATGEFALTGGSAEDIARNLVALEDGYGLHIVSRNGEVGRAAAAALLLGYAATATNCPALLTI